MFITQSKQQNQTLPCRFYRQRSSIAQRPTRSVHYSRSNSLLIKARSRLTAPSTYPSLCNRKSNASKPFYDIVRVPPEKKWEKTVNLFNMTDEIQKCSSLPIKPGITFYRALLQPCFLDLHKFKIRFPNTAIVNQQGNSQLIFTDSEGYLRVRPLDKYECQDVFKKKAQEEMKLLSDIGKNKKQIDYNINPNRPIVIQKFSDDNSSLFETDVESYRTFQEKRPLPTQNKLLQQYVFSRNMKAMIYRYCHRVEQPGKKGQSFAYRFQNEQPIFKLNKKTQALETHKLTETISVYEKRMDTLHVSKVIHPGLIKFEQSLKELIRLIEKKYRGKVMAISVDFVVDLMDVPWVINLKYIQFHQSKALVPSEQNMITSATGRCRLCDDVFKKQQLKNILSIGMLCSFLDHVKKRKRLQDQHSIKFLSELHFNSKESRTWPVCQCCYALVIEELQLIKWEKKLAQYCHLKVRDGIIHDKTQYQKLEHSTKSMVSPKTMTHWKLMLYLECITGIKSTLLASETIISFGLGGTLSHKWRCQECGYQKLIINRFKVYEFYSEDPNIQYFLKNTQISFSLMNSQSKIIARGSTGIISSFKSSAVENGQRQTSTILLFLDDQSYCNLDIKVGLATEGSFHMPDLPTKKINHVYFLQNDYTMNVSPLPREWMQAFSMSYQEKHQQITFQDINTKIKSKIRKPCKLKKTPILR